MKNVLIIGANGKVGRWITKKIKTSSDFTPTAFIREPEQGAYFDELDVSYITGSLEAEVDALTNAMKGMDAIVFSAGSGGSTGADKTLTVDLDGAVKAMEAAIKARVKRFVMVSAMQADTRKAWQASGLNTYYIAKHYADRILKTIGLDYTIIRPGLLLDSPGTGKITTTDPASQKGVPREDVANLILEVLRKENTIGQVIEFNAGETPINEALAQ